MIRQFIIDNQLYLDFLQIEIDEIPIKNESVAKQDFFKLVEKKFRELARKYHPDFGGSHQEFKYLLECKKKLIEESSEVSNLSLGVDDAKYEKYTESTMAAKLGNQIFESINENSNELGIKAVFRPTTNDHEYEWIFNILGTDTQLSLNVQNLSKELVELSSELYQDNSLSVLVCLFVPSKQMVQTIFEYDKSIQLTFNDKILLESSNSIDISEYIKDINKILEDLNKIKNNTFTSRNNTVLKTKKTNDILSQEKNAIEFLSNMKLFSPVFDSHAADFIKDL